MAGKARKRPPMVGPNSLAMSPAPAVMRPPKRKRIRYSYHRVCLRAAGWKETSTRLPQPHRPETKCSCEPDDNGGASCGQTADLTTHHPPAHKGSVKKKCDRAGDHRVGFRGSVHLAVFGDGESQSGQSDGGGSAKNSSEALRVEDIAEDGKRAHDDAADQEPDNDFRHLEFLPE